MRQSIVSCSCSREWTTQADAMIIECVRCEKWVDVSVDTKQCYWIKTIYNQGSFFCIWISLKAYVEEIKEQIRWFYMRYTRYITLWIKSKEDILIHWCCDDCNPPVITAVKSDNLTEEKCKIHIEVFRASIYLCHQSVLTVIYNTYENKYIFSYLFILYFCKLKNTNCNRI